MTETLTTEKKCCLQSDFKIISMALENYNNLDD